MKIKCALISLLVTGCLGYRPVPAELNVGMPVWIGGPSMTWKFEKVENKN